MTIQNLWPQQVAQLQLCMQQLMEQVEQIQKELEQRVRGGAGSVGTEGVEPLRERLF